MLKGKDLLDYTINQIGGNKLDALIKLTGDIYKGCTDLCREMMELINPHTLYQYLENKILEEDNDPYLIDFLESNSYPLPIRYGWKHIEIRDNQEELIDECEWYDNKHKCYIDMFSCALNTIKNCVDITCQEVKISNNRECIVIDDGGVIVKYQIYEME